MAEKVEVVIKIPKYYLTHPQDYSCLAECVRRGVLLPKGHGRLVDADDIALIDEQFYTPSDYYVAESAINDAPTIIEADAPKRRKGTPLEENDSGYNCENWIP